MGASREPDPIEQLVADLARAGRPDFAWVLRWSRDGRDPVAAAWEASRHVDAMTALLALARPDVVDRATAFLERALGPYWYSRESAEIAPALRRAVPLPPTLDELLAGAPRGGRAGA